MAFISSAHPLSLVFLPPLRSERAVQEMRRQGVSFSSLRSSSPLSPQPPSPEHATLRTPDRSADKLPEKSALYSSSSSSSSFFFANSNIINNQMYILDTLKLMR